MTRHGTRIALSALLVFGMLQAVAAQAAEASPVGLWKTIDDETGKVKSLVRISKVNGELEGKVEKVFSPPAQSSDPICDQCEGEHKGKPVVGMKIMWGLKKSADNEWSGGQILDPAKDKTYRCKVTIIEEGKKLQVRGYVVMFYRTQIWLREE